MQVEKRKTQVSEKPSKCPDWHFSSMFGKKFQVPRTIGRNLKKTVKYISTGIKPKKAVKIYIKVANQIYIKKIK